MERATASAWIPRSLALIWFTACVLSAAWVADDAFITLRTVDNLLEGYGPRWNVVERVQTYTHPLWMLVTAGTCGLTGEFVLTLIAQSVLISLAAVILLATRVARTPTAAVLGILALASSSAFVDYSTSGLENPLTHLLLALFLVVALGSREPGPARVLRLSLLTALLAVNRVDALLLCLPVLVVELWRARPVGSMHAVGALALGFLPLLLWELFSLLYYGFPFPNTAYAKLGSGIEGLELAARGLEYLGQSLDADPLTLVVTAAGLATAFVMRAHAPLAAGALLYLAYVVSVGGDFMAGRFLTAPLLVGVALLSRVPFQLPRRGTLVALVALVALALAAERPSFARPAEDEEPAPIPRSGIADERFQYPLNSLVALGLEGRVRGDLAGNGVRARKAGVSVLALHAVGMAGFFAGPEVFVLDRAGLCDPLLARLPARYDPAWRTGHFWRELPVGYPASLPDEPLAFDDTALESYAQALRLVTRAPLLDRARLRAVWELNSGARASSVDRDRYRHPLLTHLELESGLPGTWTWRAAAELELPAAAVELSASTLMHGTELSCETRQARVVRVVLYRGTEQVLDLDAADFSSASGPQRGRRSLSVAIPSSTARDGYDRVRVFPGQRREQDRLRPAWIKALEVGDTP